MKAIILAGGKGTRLAPYTVVLPKPLVPLGDRPILEILLRQLRHYGVTDVVMAVGYLAELLEAYFGDGHKLGVRITYSREEQPLGTAGPLSLIDGLDETFLVLNGDLLTNLDYRHLVQYHRQSGAACTIGMYNRQVQITLGVLKTDGDHRLVDYIEKPTYDYQVSMGVYVFEPRVLDCIRPNTYLDFPDLVKTLLRDGEQVGGYPFDGYWLDIGRHEDYAQALEEYDRMKPSLMINGE